MSQGTGHSATKTRSRSQNHFGDHNQDCLRNRSDICQIVMLFPGESETGGRMPNPASIVLLAPHGVTSAMDSLAR